MMQNFEDLYKYDTSLTGLQYQYTGYSYNLVGVASPYWPWRSHPPSHLTYTGIVLRGQSSNVFPSFTRK